MQCELPVSFSVFRSETFASSPSPSVEGAGTIMRIFGVKIFVFLCCERLSDLYCLACFLKMPPFGKQKSTCFQPRKQVLFAVFGFGRGALPFPLFNPTANQDDRKHSDRNHSGNPYGRKHPYPTPLDNAQQLQHNKDNRQNGYDAKPALFCFIIHIVSLRSPS